MSPEIPAKHSILPIFISMFAANQPLADRFFARLSLLSGARKHLRRQQFVH
jgi:hypothetical protein